MTKESSPTLLKNCTPLVDALVEKMESGEESTVGPEQAYTLLSDAVQKVLPDPGLSSNGMIVPNRTVLSRNANPTTTVL